MRKITQMMADAFIYRTSKKSGNDQVISDGIETKYYLHGNCIAKVSSEGLFVNACGWYTNTTKERLNGILVGFDAPGVYQKKGQWYFTNGEKFVYGWNKVD